ncbi:MAG: hypothetical protein AAGF02_03145 [Actinomycetota bacterium]
MMEALVVGGIVGLVASIPLTLVIFASWRWRPTAWARDLGHETDDVVGPAIVGGTTVVILLAAATTAAGMLISDHGVIVAFAGGWWSVVVFGLVDLLVIDLYVHLHVRPSWSRLEGDEHVDAAFHLRDMAATLPIAVPVAATGLGLAVLAT